jgi:hypothetical protein
VQDLITPSSRATIAELNGADFLESITWLGCPTQGWILVDALLLLLVAFEVLANPRPEFAASAGSSSAEDHSVRGGAFSLDLDLAERAALKSRFSARHGKSSAVREG